MTVSVLYARADSVYKTLRGCDVWDIERDARKYCGMNPVVAHPPCRAWGHLRGFANPRPDEKALALAAVSQVRRCGGVLEHPAYSTLWAAAGLPLPGHGIDAFGGFSVEVLQFWFGHCCEKRTWLYVVGCSRLPSIQLPLGESTHQIAGRGRLKYPGSKPGVGKATREKTPPAFARFLVTVAKNCKPTCHKQVI